MRVLWFRRVLQITFLITFIFVSSVFLVSIILDDKRPEPLADNEPPVISIIDGETVTIPLGEKYDDPGVDVYDISHDFTLAVEGEVDTNSIGEYEIKYIATDEVGNAVEMIRTVKVIKPSGVIYLTFDDGPGDSTAYLLDVLKEHNVKATFFVTGRGDDSLIKREYEEGHTIGLHSYTHNYSYIYRNTDNYFEDLNDVQQIVKEQTGVESKLLRFPGGSSNLVSTRYDGRSHIMSILTSEVEEKGFTYFDWNVDSRDAGGASTADEVYDNVIDALKWGEESIVLQHDVKDFSVEAVEKIIEYGKENNFIFRKLTPDSFDAHHDVNN